MAIIEREAPGVKARDGTAAAEATVESLPFYSWYVVILMTAVYTVHSIDRSVLVVLLEPIKAEFKLTDTNLGFLAGLSYAVSFALAGIPLGMLADRVNRRNLLAVLILIWGGLTALSGLTRSYMGLIFARMGVGAAESGAMPICLSIIADYVPRSRRAVAAGIFMSATGLGTLIGMSTNGLIAENFGWRAAFLVAGVPGILLTIVLLVTLREPKRRGSEGPPVAAASFREVIAFVVRQRSLCLILSATVIYVLANAGLVVWLSSFLIRVHGFALGEAGIAVALVSGVMNVVGALTGAYLMDHVGRWDLRAQPRYASFMISGAAFAVAVAVLAENVYVALVFAAIWTFLFTACHAAAFSLVPSLAPSRMRSTIVAILAVLNNILGFGLGPQIVGALSDAYHPMFGSESIRYAMASVAICYVIAGLLFFKASGHRLIEDMERAGN